MILDTTIINLIKNTVKTAQLVGIDGIAIDKDSIRGINDDKSAVLFHTENIPTLPFESIGLRRLNVFSSRLSILETRKNMSIDAVLHNNQVQSLFLKGDSTHVDFRCANVEKILAPRAMHDELVYQISLNPEAVMMLVKAQSAMGAELVTIVGNEDGVTFEMVDESNDVFSFKFADDITYLTSNNDNFVYRYPIKMLLSLFKQNTEASFEITSKGLLRYVVNGLTVIVVRRA